MAEDQGRREVRANTFGDHAFIQQGTVRGSVHVHNYPRAHDPHHHSPSAEAVHVIPYPRNEDLVVRQDLTGRLNALLQPPQAARSCSAALWGLGGSGKTQIALDFAYRQCDDTECSVFWIHADTEATFLADCKTIGQSLGLDETLDGVDLLNAVRRGIEARPPWALILDNADDLRLFGVTSAGEGANETLFRHLPRLSRGTILWTSRDKNIAGTLVGARRGIEVRAMTNDEATLLLERVADVLLTAEEKGLADLLQELQRLPLAVSQAGAYMRRTSMTIEDYLGLLRRGKSRWEVLKRSDFDRHRRPTVSNSVLETYRISIERIRQESEMSYRILHTIAYISSQGIPHELITAASRDSGNHDSENSEPTVYLEVQQAIVRLQEFSFLSMLRKEDGGRSYDMHKLVQEAVRYGLRERRQVESGPDRTGEGESDPSPPESYYAKAALRIVDVGFPISKPGSWERCEQYLAHAIEVSEWAEISRAEIDTLGLLDRVSEFLLDRGRWGEMEPVDRRTLEIRQRVLGAEHPDTLISIANLASTYRNQGQWNKAESLEVQVIETIQHVLGAEHPDTLTSMANLASTYYHQGRWNEAELLNKHVMETRQCVLGAEHPGTLTSMANLASTYHSQARYDEALMLHEEAYQLRRRILGDAHPDTAQSMRDLAATQECLKNSGLAQSRPR